MKSADKTFVYGTRAVIEAIHAGKELDKILVQNKLNNPLVRELLAVARAHRVPLQRVPIQKLNQYTRKNHQGIVALFSAISYSSLDHVLSQTYSEGRVPLIVILDRVTDVRNFGAIARTAEASGANAIVVQLTGHAQITGDAIKTSAGALNHIPVCRVSTIKACIKELQENGLQVVACSEKADKLMYEVDFSIPTAILMGSEHDGIEKGLLGISDHHIKIPMAGNISSLNVSVATGLVLYECVRQRLQL